MQTIPYPQLGETLYAERLPNGLSVYVLPKEGYGKTYATFSTKYGSIDNRFRVDGGDEISVPDGIAHFLEHKMFEEPEGDVFNAFAANGASANAYTSFDRTVYLFSATTHIMEHLGTLLNFVQNPYWSEASVEKEKGIIGQEINMYQDNPDWRAYYGLVEALYGVHPIHIDIAGTVESISHITKETLLECYRTFYHPSNMALFVVGGVDPAEVFAFVKQNQAAKTFPSQGTIHRLFDEEPEGVVVARKESKLAVSLPKCMIGFKDNAPGVSGEDLLRLELTTKLLLDCLFSSSSPVYQRLYDEELITDGFGHEFNSAKQYAFTVIGGDTPNPDRLIARLREEIETLQRTGIDEATFERSRRKKIGSYLRMLNSPEAIAGEFTKRLFHGMDMFRVQPVYESITLDEVNARLRTHFNWNRQAVNIIRRERT